MIPLSFVYALYRELKNQEEYDFNTISDDLSSALIKDKLIRGHTYVTQHHPDCSLPSNILPWTRYSIETAISNKISYTNKRANVIVYAYDNIYKEFDLYSVALPDPLELLAIYYLKLGYWAYEIPGLGVYVTPPIGKETFFATNSPCSCKGYKLSKNCPHTVVKDYYLNHRKLMYLYKG